MEFREANEFTRVVWEDDPGFPLIGPPRSSQGPNRYKLHPCTIPHHIAEKSKNGDKTVCSLCSISDICSSQLTKQLQKLGETDLSLAYGRGKCRKDSCVPSFLQVCLLDDMQAEAHCGPQVVSWMQLFFMHFPLLTHQVVSPSLKHRFPLWLRHPVFIIHGFARCAESRKFHSTDQVIMV